MNLDTPYIQNAGSLQIRIYQWNRLDFFALHLVESNIVLFLQNITGLYPRGEFRLPPSL